MDIKDILKAARQQGWREQPTKKGVMLYPPYTTKDGVLIHFTPSDRRAMANTLAQLRRSGFVWPWPPAKGQR